MLTVSWQRLTQILRQGSDWGAAWANPSFSFDLSTHYYHYTRTLKTMSSAFQFQETVLRLRCLSDCGLHWVPKTPGSRMVPPGQLSVTRIMTSTLTNSHGLRAHWYWLATATCQLLGPGAQASFKIGKLAAPLAWASGLTYDPALTPVKRCLASHCLRRCLYPCAEFASDSEPPSQQLQLSNYAILKKFQAVRWY